MRGDGRGVEARTHGAMQLRRTREGQTSEERGQGVRSGELYVSGGVA